MAKWDSTRSNQSTLDAFRYKVRARYADVDGMGVVYHSRYLEWFEAARTEMLREAGLSYRELIKLGVQLPVIEARCRYLRSVHYDDVVEIRTQINEVTRAKMRIGYTVFGSDEEAKAEGFSLHCFINTQGRAVRAPEFLLSFFQTMFLNPD